VKFPAREIGFHVPTDILDEQSKYIVFLM